MMAKAKKKSKDSATASKRKVGAKMTGEDVIDLDTPPKKKKKGTAKRAAVYFLTATLKGFMVNPYSRRSKNRINVVFHNSGVPSKAEKPVVSLGGSFGKSFSQTFKQWHRGSRRTLPVSMGRGIPRTRTICNKRVCIRSRGSTGWFLKLLPLTKNAWATLLN